MTTVAEERSAATLQTGLIDHTQSGTVDKTSPQLGSCRDYSRKYDLHAGQALAARFFCH